MVPAQKCSGCGTLISQHALDAGRAQVMGGLMYCEDCARLIREPDMDEDDGFPVPDQAAPTDATVELSVERLRRKLEKRRRLKKQQNVSERVPASRLTAVIIAVIVLALIATVIVLLRR